MIFIQPVSLSLLLKLRSLVLWYTLRTEQKLPNLKDSLTLQEQEGKKKKEGKENWENIYMYITISPCHPYPNTFL